MPEGVAVEIKVETGDSAAHPAKAIVVILFEGVKAPGGATGAVDKALDGAISALIAEGEIKGKQNELTLIHTLGRLPSPRPRAAAPPSVAPILHGAGIAALDAEACAQAIAEGAVMGAYRFRYHKHNEDADKELDALSIVESDKSKLDAIRRGVERGCIFAEATNYARDMANEPANVFTPTAMAERAQALAAEAGLECEVLDRDKMEELGMGALLGVAAGSVQPPKFIVLRYRGRPDSQETLGLLGKGITFDSGGISIKPAAGMEEMKGDMSAGAAIIASMWAIGKLRPAINVTALVPTTENMPSGSATKPGDILRAMNGKTIEVINT